MKREQPWERPLTWLTNVVTILAAGGAAFVAAAAAILNVASHVPQPWLTILVVASFVIAFGLFRVGVEAWRRSHPTTWPFGRDTQWTQVSFANQDISLTESPPPDAYIQGKTFDRCIFRGPAVLLPAGSGNVFRGATNLYAGGRDIFWEIPQGSMTKAGAIVVEDCIFNDCSFISVGLAGPLDFIHQLDPAWQPRKATAT
jgi:hypothetical protein